MRPVFQRQLCVPVLPDHGTYFYGLGKKPEELGIINQYGLSRKVGAWSQIYGLHEPQTYALAAYLRLGQGQPETPPTGTYRLASM